jgi:hypothetical protein
MTYPIAYPTRLDIEAAPEQDRWRPFAQWALALPHLVILQALQAASQAVAVVSWFWILFTGRLPAGLASFQAMYLRYWMRTASYVGFLREAYPPFGFTTSVEDPGDDPHVRLDVSPRLEDRNRLTTFFRLVLVIPHVLVLALLSLAALIVLVVAAFAVLFTGRWPDGLRAFVVGTARWSLRVEAYLLLLVDDYPPFAFDDLSEGPRGGAPEPVAPFAS